MILWSIAILRKNELPKWFGYYGLVVGDAFLAILLSGFILVSLQGFRFFVFAIVTWILLNGIFLRNATENPIV